MKYFIDTEFHEYKKDGIDTIELISIGIVAEDGREYYSLCGEFDLDAACRNDWLRDNVLLNIVRSYGSGPVTIASVFYAFAKSKAQIAAEVVDFIHAGYSEPEFYGYYCDYDWVVFCWLFGRMIDLPDGFPMYCRDLKQMYDAMNEECYLFVPGNDKTLKDQADYPKQVEEHHALDDARWNRDLYVFLTNIDLESTQMPLPAQRTVQSAK